jgi:tetratricopeptide (TPR) repeat protein
MFFLSDAAWRVLLLLLAAVTPTMAPVEAAPTHTLAAACARLGVLALVYGLGTAYLRRIAPRYPGAAALTAITLVLAPIVSAVFSGERGPLARGVWVLGPLAWAALAAIAAGPLADRVSPGASRKARAAVGVLVVALGVGSLVMARGRLGSREALWESVLVIDPTNESAALAVAAKDHAAHKEKEALDVLLACARAHAESCPCAEAVAETAVNVGRYPDARRVLDATDTCARTPRRMGIEAESLVGSTDALDEGAREASRVLQRAPDEPHALFARAWATVQRGHPADALDDAKRAVELGRGIPAELLYGFALFQDDDLPGADVQFGHVLAEDPTVIQAAYDHALVADKQHRYHDAREGYLRVLQLDPTSADARYNLVLLTHAHGADQEARHHVDEFAVRHPGDGRIAWLRQLVSQSGADATQTR